MAFAFFERLLKVPALLSSNLSHETEPTRAPTKPTLASLSCCSNHRFCSCFSKDPASQRQAAPQNGTHHHLHCAPQRAPRTRRARRGRCGARRRRRPRWAACCPGAGSPSARTATSSSSLRGQRHGAAAAHRALAAREPALLWSWF